MYLYPNITRIENIAVQKWIAIFLCSTLFLQYLFCYVYFNNIFYISKVRALVLLLMLLFYVDNLARAPPSPIWILTKIKIQIGGHKNEKQKKLYYCKAA